MKSGVPVKVRMNAECDSVAENPELRNHRSKRFYLNRRAFIARRPWRPRGRRAIVEPRAARAADPRRSRTQAVRTVKSPLSGSDSPKRVENTLTTYNNFYEFGPSKGDPARQRARLQAASRGRSAIEGECAKPGTMQPRRRPEGRRRSRIASTGIRCVEAWSMVIPWVGFPLAELHQALRADVESRVTSSSRRCSIRRRCPGSRAARCTWPYVEGLRMDEAMHPLTILGRRPLRRSAAEPERRAASPRGALELRVQGHQVDREGPFRRRSSRSIRGSSSRAAGIRLLRQRQPGRSLIRDWQPGHRAAAPSMFRTIEDAAVQLGATADQCG